MKQICLIFVFLILFPLVESNSQPPCKPDSKSYFYEMPHLQSYPPLSIGMPYEVLIGYIAADSVCRNSRADYLNDFMKRQNNNDTLRYIMKYYYWMTDYNPLILNQYTKHSYPDKMPANFIVTELFNRLNSLMPISSQLLIQSSYILHVNVENTIIVDSVQGVLCKDLTVATTTILDTIKGQVIPVIGISLTNLDNNDVNNQQSTTEHFIFNFCNQWTRANQEPLNDGLGNTWLQPNSEYIVFLYPRMVCNDSSYYYLTIFPAGPNTLSHGMYPIINGNVQDIGNDFGLGTSVPLIKFKQHLQTLISQIKNYGN